MNTQPESLEEVLKKAQELGDAAANGTNPPAPQAGEPNPPAAAVQEPENLFPSAEKLDIDLSEMPLLEARVCAHGLALGISRAKVELGNYLQRNSNRMLGVGQEAEATRTRSARILGIMLLPQDERKKLIEEKPEAGNIREAINKQMGEIVTSVAASLDSVKGLQPLEAAQKIVAFLLNQIPKELDIKKAVQIQTYGPSALRDAYTGMDNLVRKGTKIMDLAAREALTALQEQSIKQVEIEERVADITRILALETPENRQRLDEIADQGILLELPQPLSNWICKTDEQTYRALLQLLHKENSGKETAAEILEQVNAWVESGQHVSALVKTAETAVEKSVAELQELREAAIRISKGEEPKTPAEEEMADLRERTKNLHEQLSADLNNPNLASVANRVHRNGLERAEMILALPQSMLAAYQPLHTGINFNTRATDPREVLITEIGTALHNRGHKVNDPVGTTGNMLGATLQALRDLKTKVPEGNTPWARDATAAAVSLISATMEPLSKAKGNLLIFQDAAADAASTTLPAAENRLINLLVQAPEKDKAHQTAILGVLSNWNQIIGDRSAFEESLEKGDRRGFNPSLSSIRSNNEKFSDLLQSRKTNYNTLLQTINPDDPNHLARTVYFRQARKGDALNQAMSEAEATRTSLNRNHDQLASLNYILDGLDRQQLLKIATGDPEKRQAFQAQVHQRLTEAIRNTQKSAELETSIQGYASDFFHQRVGSLNLEVDMGPVISRLEAIRIETNKTEDNLAELYTKQEAHVGFLRSLAETGQGKEEPQLSENQYGINNVGYALNRAFQIIETKGPSEASEKTEKMLSKPALLEVLNAATHSREAGAAMLEFEKIGRSIFGKETPNDIMTSEKIGFFVALKACTMDVTRNQGTGLEKSQQVYDTLPEGIETAFRSYSNRTTGRSTVLPKAKQKETEPVR